MKSSNRKIKWFSHTYKEITVLITKWEIGLGEGCRMSLGRFVWALCLGDSSKPKPVDPWSPMPRLKLFHWLLMEGHISYCFQISLMVEV